MVGVPASGGDELRPRRKRSRGAHQAREAQLPERSSEQLAADCESRLLAAGAQRFADQEPTEEFVWLFINTDGSVSEYPTTMANYERFKALYGVPSGRWRRP